MPGRSRSCSFSKLGFPSHITTISPSMIAGFFVRTLRSGYRGSMKVIRRFWNRWRSRRKQMARVPSHLSS